MQDPENILVHSSANAGEHATSLAGVAVGCTQEPDEFADLEAELTAKDPRYPARKAASEALHQYIHQWIGGYEYDDGESGPHDPSEFERFVIEDAFYGLTDDDDYNRLHDAHRALCGPLEHATPLAGDAIGCSQGSRDGAAAQVRQRHGLKLERYPDGSFAVEGQGLWFTVDPREDAEDNFCRELVSVLDSVWLAASPNLGERICPLCDQPPIPDCAFANCKREFAACNPSLIAGQDGDAIPKDGILVAPDLGAEGGETIPVRFDILYEYAQKCRVDYGHLCRTVRDAIAEGSRAALGRTGEAAQGDALDARRLDWLDAQWVDGVHVEVGAKGTGYGIYNPRATIFLRKFEGSADNVRAAIDAAMSTASSLPASTS